MPDGLTICSLERSCIVFTTAPIFPSPRTTPSLGTFYYRPGTLPERLGIVDPTAYPHSNDFWKVMKLPFERESKIEAGNRGFSEAPAADLP